MVTKTSKRAARKTGAKKKSSKKRSGAKPRKARASRPSPADDAAPAAVTADSAAKPSRKESLSAAAIERANLVAYRSECAAMPRDAWVARIKNPRQRILADAVAKICALFGIPPDVLRHDRSDQSPLSRNENSIRGIALGACIDVGLAMGCSWNELHTHAAIGRSEVLDLPPHASAIRVARARWTAVQTMDGIVLEVARTYVAQVAAKAMQAVAALGGRAAA
jgi:hypothetical protein